MRGKNKRKRQKRLLPREHLASFVSMERKWEEGKLRKPINEFGLLYHPNSFIDFRNFLSSHFLSTIPNGPFILWSHFNGLLTSIFNLQNSNIKL
jgi:hypothetical protein